MFKSSQSKIIVSGIAALSLLHLTACTTTGTRDRVLAEPMTADLEAQVLKETGISGAVLGALAGAVVVGGATMLAARAAGASAEEALIAGAIGALAGGTGGGMAGYSQGKKKGQEIVGEAMTRDQVAKYLQGAKDYNANLAKNNAAIRAGIQSARQIEKPNVRKAQLARLDKAARTELKDVEKREAQREKALENLNWDSADASAYRQRLAELKQQKVALINTINELNAS